MRIPKRRLAVLREHIKAESTHDMKDLLDGMTADCFNDVACVPKPFVGPKKVAERYRKHWAGFPDFKVGVKRILAAERTVAIFSVCNQPESACGCELWSYGTLEATSSGARPSFSIWARSRSRSALRWWRPRAAEYARDNFDSLLNSTLVSRTQPHPMEHASCVESRLDVRRFRGLCVDPHRWCGAPSTTPTCTIFPDPRLCRSNHRDDFMRLGGRGHGGWHSGRLHRSQANHDLRDSDLLDHDRTQRIFL